METLSQLRMIVPIPAMSKLFTIVTAKVIATPRTPRMIITSQKWISSQMMRRSLCSRRGRRNYSTSILVSIICFCTCRFATCFRF